MDHHGFCVTRDLSAVLDQKAGIADPESPDAATEIPFCLMPCGVIFFFCLFLLPPTLSVRRRETGNFRGVTAYLGGCDW